MSAGGAASAQEYLLSSSPLPQCLMIKAALLVSEWDLGSSVFPSFAPEGAQGLLPGSQAKAYSTTVCGSSGITT